ncbi:MAG: hypothetical protein JWQ43_3770 [Glaciihabitans sp.]|nr:hypothetical protein [Glaciihabitans sp.]
MDDVRSQVKELGTEAVTARDYRPGDIHHIVLFRFAGSTTEGQRHEVERRFRELAFTPHPDGTGPYIRSITAGAQSSGEGAAHGFELGFVVRFASEGDRNFYVGAPLVEDATLFDHRHAAFKEFVGPLLEADGNGVLVFDFADTRSAKDHNTGNHG